MVRINLRRARIAALVLLAITGTFEAYDFWTNLRALRQGERVLPAFRVETPSLQVTVPDEVAVRAGLRPGDRILQVEGEPFRGRSTLERALNRGLAEIRLQVESGPGQVPVRREVVLPAALQTFPTWSAEWWLGVALGLITPVFCFALGYVVVLLRPLDVRAWILLMLLLSFAQLNSFEIDQIESWPSPLRVPALFYSSLLGASWPVWMLVFSLRFPKRLPLDRKHPWIKWILIGPLTLFAAVGATYTVLISDAIGYAAPFAWLLSQAGLTPLILSMVSVGFCFAALGYKQGVAQNPDDRRRLRLLNIGARISMAPMFAQLIAALMIKDGVFSFPLGFPTLTLLIFALFPLTLAYVVVVERALDLKIVIRQGLQYALARNSIRFIRFLLTATVVLLLAGLVNEPGTRLLERFLLIVGGLAALFLIGGAAQRVSTFIDRRFFRDQYDAEQLLTELSESVSTLMSPDQLFNTVSRRIALSLHVEKIAAFVERNGGFAMAMCTTEYPGEPPVLEKESPLVVQLRDRNTPLSLYVDPAGAWIARQPEFAGLRVVLQNLETQVLLPLRAHERLIGFFSLGPKRSEEPYNRNDLRLLNTVAAQTALALENSRLAQELAARERLRREIEIAREVQERLFPQKTPSAPGMDLAGVCRPASGVGGDYYDFLELPEGRIGIAVGDVAGKGVPAAILMATLQASVRGLAGVSGDNLTDMMVRINRALESSSASNRYATFFFALYDPATGILRYVNCGHNPPYLFRAPDCQECEALEKGGSVLGLLPEVEFEEGTVELRAGDYLVAYSDGLSEAMNPAGEEWGEERLQQTARGCASLSARELTELLLEESEKFVSGAPAHDDVTVVVLKAG